MVAQLVSFFLALAILRETEMDVNENLQCHFEKKKQTNTQVNSNFPWSVLLSTIEMTSKCLKLCCGTTSRHNIALAILRETSTEIDVKTFNDIVKKNKTNKQTNQQQFSMVCTLIDHRNDVKMFKTLRWNH